MEVPILYWPIWRAAFIIVYLICVALAGVPVMVSEFVVGRRANANPVGAFKKLAPEQPGMQLVIQALRHLF